MIGNLPRADRLPADVKLTVFNRVAALYADERFLTTPGTIIVREFAEAYIWSRALMPGRLDDERRREWWRLLHRLAGQEGRQYWAKSVYAKDLPRWEPDDLDTWRGGCDAILTRGPRQGHACGKRAALQFRLNHPDGTWHVSGWCSAHRPEGERLSRTQREESRRVVPVPCPNRGGLLPSHFPEAGWEGCYKAARSNWEPTQWGIRADDWPVLSKVAAHEAPPEMERPALRLIPGGAA